MAMAGKTRFLGLAISLVLAQVTAAYEHPLSPHAVREAYFLGQRQDEAFTSFLAQYVQGLPRPKRGPHVAEVEISTPYKQVVLRAHLAVNYSSQQAEQEYRSQQDRILVRVRIDLTPTYPAQTSDTSRGKGGIRLRPANFWRDFTFRVMQGKPVTPRSVTGQPLYLPGFGSSMTGAEVCLEFDAEQIASGPLRIEIMTPDGQRVAARFDLARLR